MPSVDPAVATEILRLKQGSSKFWSKCSAEIGKRARRDDAQSLTRLRMLAQLL